METHCPDSDIVCLSHFQIQFSNILGLHLYLPHSGQRRREQGLGRVLELSLAWLPSPPPPRPIAWLPADPSGDSVPILCRSRALGGGVGVGQRVPGLCLFTKAALRGSWMALEGGPGWGLRSQELH